MLLFIRETVRELGEQRATGFLKKFYGWYLGRGRFPKPFKQELVQLPTIAEVETRLLAAAPGAREALERLEEELPEVDEILLDRLRSRSTAAARPWDGVPRGQLLIASASPRRPQLPPHGRARGSEHGDEGAMGLVLNRPSPTDVVEAVPALEDMVEPGAALYLGGPVQPESVVVLGEFREPAEAAVVVTGRIGFMPADSEPGAIAAVTDRVRVFAGYAGWGTGQLEARSRRRSWILEPARPTTSSATTATSGAPCCAARAAVSACWR